MRTIRLNDIHGAQPPLGQPKEKKSFCSLSGLNVLFFSAALLLTGCYDDAVQVQEQPAEAIGFGWPTVADMTAQTRGRLVIEDNQFHQNFNVYAYSNEKSQWFMEDVTVHITQPHPGDVALFYDNIKRWSDWGNSTFYAFSPDIDDPERLTIDDSTLPPTITYNVPRRVTEQRDLLVAVPRTLRGLDVQFTFYHVLSAVQFKMSSEVSTSLTIRNIKISGVYNEGTFTLNNTTPATTSFMQGAAKGDKVSYQLDMPSGYTWPGNTQEYINDGENAFLVIPQTLGADAQVTVTIEMDGEQQDYTASIANDQWQAGYINLYTMSIKNGRLILRASVKPWTLSDADTFAQNTFTANEEVKIGWTSYVHYDSDGDYSNIWNNPYIAVAAGEVPPYTNTDEQGNQTTIYTHAPLRSAVLSLTTSCTDPLTLTSDNAYAKFAIFDEANNKWFSEGTGDAAKMKLYDSYPIAAGNNQTLHFAVVAYQEDLSGAATREVKIRLRRDSARQSYVPITHDDLPGSSDHMYIPFYLMTPAEFDGGIPTITLMQ